MSAAKSQRLVILPDGTPSCLPGPTSVELMAKVDEAKRLGVPPMVLADPRPPAVQVYHLQLRVLPELDRIFEIIPDIMYSVTKLEAKLGRMEGLANALTFANKLDERKDRRESDLLQRLAEDLLPAMERRITQLERLFQADHVRLNVLEQAAVDAGLTFSAAKNISDAKPKA